eukprot:6120723-Amphidinium_carterae.2
MFRGLWGSKDHKTPNTAEETDSCPHNQHGTTYQCYCALSSVLPCMDTSRQQLPTTVLINSALSLYGFPVSNQF